MAGLFWNSYVSPTAFTRLIQLKSLRADLKE